MSNVVSLAEWRARRAQREREAEVVWRLLRALIVGVTLWNAMMWVVSFGRCKRRP